jgi:hypothetical protein
VHRGHVHLIVWDYGPRVALLDGNHPLASGPLAFSGRDVTGAFEGFPYDHAFAARSLTLNGEALEILADLGPKPADSARLRKVNRVLETLRVASSRVVLPRGRVLAAGRLSLRLLPGWSGRIEIPPSRFAAKLVVRASHGTTSLTLLELPGPVGARRFELPVTLQRVKDNFARRVFSTEGRSFDVSAVFASPTGFADANRLLAGLRLSRPG